MVFFRIEFYDCSVVLLRLRNVRVDLEMIVDFMVRVVLVSMSGRILGSRCFMMMC